MRPATVAGHRDEVHTRSWLCVRNPACHGRDFVVPMAAISAHIGEADFCVRKDCNHHCSDCDVLLYVLGIRVVPMPWSRVRLCCDAKPKVIATRLAISRKHRVEQRFNPICVLTDVVWAIVHTVARTWGQAPVCIAFQRVAKCVGHVVEDENWSWQG